MGNRLPVRINYKTFVDSAAVGQVLNLTVQRGDRSQRIAVRTAELQGAA